VPRRLLDYPELLDLLLALDFGEQLKPIRPVSHLMLEEELQYTIGRIIIIYSQ